MIPTRHIRLLRGVTLLCWAPFLYMLASGMLIVFLQEPSLKSFAQVVIGAWVAVSVLTLCMLGLPVFLLRASKRIFKDDMRGVRSMRRLCALLVLGVLLAWFVTYGLCPMLASESPDPAQHCEHSFDHRFFIVSFGLYAGALCFYLWFYRHYKGDVS